MPLILWVIWFLQGNEQQKDSNTFCDAFIKRKTAGNVPGRRGAFPILLPGNAMEALLQGSASGCEQSISVRVAYST